MSDLVCARCSGAVDPGDRFCPHCGTEVSGDATGVIPALDDSGPMPPVSGSLAADLPAGLAALVVQRGRDEGARFVLSGDEAVTGRAADADIFLDDVTVSRHHAQLRRAGASWEITDAGSLNGTYVNRQLISGPTVLRAGDELQIGKYRFLFVVAPES